MDYIVRATAADGQIRAFAATTRETVETARQDHNTSPVATAALGRLLTAWMRRVRRSLSPFIITPIIAPAVRRRPSAAVATGLVL